MPGRFYDGEKKVRPGIYYNEQSEDDGIQIAAARNGVVAVAFRANWGPLGKVVTIDDPSEIAQHYGDDSGEGSTVGIIKKIMAGGAATIKAIRVGTGGSNATITLKDSADADAVTLTAVHPGNRPLSVTIKDSLAIQTQRECIIYSGVTELMKVAFTKGGAEAEALVAAIGAAKNAVVTAAKLESTAELAAVSQSEFTAGTSPEITSADYSAAFELLEAEVFNTVCVDTTDDAVRELLKSFVLRASNDGLLATGVTADDVTVDFATRKEHAVAMNTQYMHHVINGFQIGDVVYVGADAAAYVAGVIASVPCNDSITHHKVPGATEVVGGMTNAQIIEALECGCIVFTTASSGAVWIEQGINTLTTLAPKQDAGWKKIRRTKTRFELITRINESAESLPGDINNDPNGHVTIKAIANGVINAMISEGKLVSGTAELDPNNPAEGDSVWFVLDVQDLDSVEKIYFTYKFHFGA